MENIISDSGDGICQRDLGQIIAVIEAVGTDTGNAAANADDGDLITVLIPGRTVVTGVVRHGAFAGNGELAIIGQQVAQVFTAAAAGENGAVIAPNSIQHIVVRPHGHPLIHGAVVGDLRLGAVGKRLLTNGGNGGRNVDGFQIGAVFEHSPSDVGNIFGQSHTDNAATVPGNGALIRNIGHCAAAGQLQVAFDGQGVEMVVAVVAPGADGAVGADSLEYIFIDSGPLIHGAGKVQIRRGVAAEAGMTHKLQRSGQMDADHLLAVIEDPGAHVGNTLGHGDFRQQTAVAKNTAANGLDTIGNHKVLQLGAVIEQVVRQVLDQIAGESHSLQCAAVGEDADAKLRYGGGNGHADQVGAVGECAVINGGQAFGQGNTGQAAAVGERTVTDGSQGAGQTDDRQIVAVIEGTDTDGGNTLADTDFLDHGPIYVPGNTAAVSIVVHGTGADDPQDAILGQDILRVFTAGAALVDHVIGAVDLHIVGRICLYPLLHGAAEGDALQTRFLEGIACDAGHSVGNIQVLQAGTVVERLAVNGLQANRQVDGGQIRAAAEGRIRHLGDVGRQGDDTLGLVESCPVFCFLQSHTVNRGVFVGRIAAVPGVVPAFPVGSRIGIGGGVCGVEAVRADGFHGGRNIDKGQSGATVERFIANGLDAAANHNLLQAADIPEDTGGDLRHRVGNDECFLRAVQRSPVLGIAFRHSKIGGYLGVAAIGMVPAGIPAFRLFRKRGKYLRAVLTTVENTVRIGAAGDGGHTGGDIDTLQCSTIAEGAGADGGHAFGQNQILQTGTAIEAQLGDGIDGIGEGHLLQTGTAIECLLTQRGNGIRHHDLFQRSTAIEGIGFNGGNGGRNVDLLQILIVLEEILRDTGDALGDLDDLGSGVDTAPELTFVAHRIVMNGGLTAVGNVVPVSTPAGGRRCQLRKDGQAAAAVEGTGGLAGSGNGGDGCRDLDHLQSRTICERAAADGLQALRQGDRRQAAAAGESGTADLTQRIGQLHAGQVAAAAEHAGVQEGDTVADLDLFQAGTALEDGKAYIFGGCVEIHFFQICAVSEHIAANSGDGIGNGDGLQAFATVERISLKFGDRFRNGQIGKRRTV